MLAHDYLFLGTRHLASGEEWDVKEDGLFFLFPTSGEGRCVSPRAAQPFRREDVLVMDLASFHKVCATGDGELTFNYFTLSFEHLFPLFGAKDIHLLNSVRDAFKGIMLYPASTPLAIECHRLLKEVPRNFELDHRGQLLRIVSSIVSMELRQAHSQRVGLGYGVDHIAKICEQLSITELLHMSIDDLAFKFGCSSRHLNRLFHQYFGLSVAALRMEMRMMKAVSLLRDPDTKLLDVADQCGFNHLSLFNASFKKRFGIAPGRWRKRTASKLNGEAREDVPDESNLACPLEFNGFCAFNEVPKPPGIPVKISQNSKPNQSCNNSRTNGYHPAGNNTLREVLEKGVIRGKLALNGARPREL